MSTRSTIRLDRSACTWSGSDRSDTLQAPGELKRLASYDNVFSATPHRVVEFTFDSLEAAGRYFERKELSLIFRSELPSHGTNIRITVLALRGDYSKDAMAGAAPAREDPS